MQPLAILGGTFDPVHLGHLRAALEAADALDAEVHLIPANLPPRRPPPIANAQQRVAMLRAALDGHDRLLLDTRELERDGPSYTFDTLASLRHEIGAQRPLVLLLGNDAYAGLPSWHRWRELFDLAHIAVLTRPGHAPLLPAELADAIEMRVVTDAAGLQTSSAGQVLHLAITPLEISATRVRELLVRGGDPRWLLPDTLLADPALLAPYRQSSF